MTDRLQEEEGTRNAFAPKEIPPRDLGGLPSRCVALFLDIILMSALLALILIQVVLPKWYPGAFEEMRELFEERPEEVAEEEYIPSELVMNAAKTSNVISLIGFTLYFGLSPALFGGGTLGMRVVNLRIEQAFRKARPPLNTLLFRGFIKAVCLQIWFPYLAIFFLMVFMNRNKQTGHDWLAKTVVVRGSAFTYNESNTENSNS